jgi:hypothetical protein
MKKTNIKTEHKQEFNFGFGRTKTTEDVLRIVNNLNLKGYTSVIKDKNSYDIYNYLNNFFIWRKLKNNKPQHEYIRLTLMCQGYNEKTLFYWDLEKSFKPFNWNHNHRENAHIKSESFTEKEKDKYYNYFLNMINELRGKI